MAQRLRRAGETLNEAQVLKDAHHRMEGIRPIFLISLARKYFGYINRL
ncbi:MAG: hypothetical protein ACREOO_32840 [bacterium]